MCPENFSKFVTTTPLRLLIYFVNSPVSFSSNKKCLCTTHGFYLIPANKVKFVPFAFILYNNESTHTHTCARARLGRPTQCSNLPFREYQTSQIIAPVEKNMVILLGRARGEWGCNDKSRPVISGGRGTALEDTENNLIIGGDDYSD